MIPNEFIFIGELYRLKGESRPWVLLTLKRWTCTWVQDDEFRQVHEYFEILKLVRRLQQLSRLVR